MANSDSPETLGRVDDNQTDTGYLMNQPESDTIKSGSLKRAGWISTLVVWLSVGPVLAFVASQLGNLFFVCELISNFQLHIFFLLIPFPVLAFLAGRRRWALFLTAVTIYSSVLVAPVFLPTGGARTDEEVVKVMSYNVLGKNPEHASVINIIMKEEPDILLVVEYSRPWRTPLSILNDKYPHRIEVPRWHGFGIALFSKFPIASEKVLHLAKEHSDFPAIDAKIQVGSRELRLFGIHTVSPRSAERMKLRNQQFEEIGEYLETCDEPTILMGDFNCTPWSSYLSRLLSSTGLRDSRRGFGYLPTWNAKQWSFRRIPIDHFFVSDQIQVHQRTVGRESGGSDHFPIIAEISIGK